MIRDSVPKRAILPRSWFLQFIRTTIFLRNYLCKDATNISKRHLQKTFRFSTSNKGLMEVCRCVHFRAFPIHAANKYFQVVFKDGQKSDKVRNTHITSDEEKEPIINQ